MGRVVLTVLIIGLAATRAVGDDAAATLPSWNEGPAKAAIVDFVRRVTTDGGADFVPPAERIAVFDNDGTLWCEQPMYFQLLFAVDRIKALAGKHPEWQDKEPYRSVLNGDMQRLAAAGEKGLLELVAATHAGMTTEEFAATVKEWMKTARHPRYQRPYNECVYQPMIELLAYLRANGFKTFIVSGGGVEFMRPWTEETYGIPPEQVVGSSGIVTFEMQDGRPVLMKQAKVEFIDDGPGKPVGINRFIGRRPLMAFGNSDGDLQMLQWTTAGAGPRFALLVHHADAQREYAYDRNSRIGRLDKAWDAALMNGWTVVDMQRDWKEVFPPKKEGDR
jgi:phosphoglycolate phosphatase-like HAD superfamily hydrolase